MNRFSEALSKYERFRDFFKSVILSGLAGYEFIFLKFITLSS